MVELMNDGFVFVYTHITIITYTRVLISTDIVSYYD